MTPKDRKRLRDLHARIGSGNEGERNAAWRKLDALLKRLGKSWNDLPELLRDDVTSASTPPQSDPRDAVPSNPFDLPGAPTPADTVRAMLEDYVALDPHEYVAATLWVIHTHVFDQFMVTPRLLLRSPVRNCGKTTLLDVVSRLVARPEKSDSITAAAIYYAVNSAKRTLLLDEADNLELSARAVLRAVLNAGHRRGGAVTRMLQGRSRRFEVFAPIALASIGSLTLPLMSRSIVLRMRRHDGARSLHRYDDADVEKLDIVYTHVHHWVQRAALNRDPEMPTELRDRRADNWRPLIAIADACGPVWSALAREAAVSFAHRDRDDEDVAVTLLHHVRQVFDARAVERLASSFIVADLLDLDEMWSEWRGVRGDERPRKLTQGALAVLLRPFNIRPHKFWPANRQPTSKSIADISVRTSRPRGLATATTMVHGHSRAISSIYE